jgi:NAD(P)-dependent dehydrogenase (short-subunit alcohol dehydrogenase family)
MKAFQGVAIVTGGAQGIGEAVARQLARDGARVVVADIQKEKALGVAESLRTNGFEALGCFLDLADPQSAHDMAAATLAEYGCIDALVNNGGIDAPPGAAWEIDEEHWRQLIDVDLTGQWWCTKAVLPAMMAQKSGRIVYVSSGSIFKGGDYVSVAYCAAKSGLVGMTVGLSSQLEKYGILVNCLVPGPTGNTGVPMDPAEVPGFLATNPLGFGGTQPMSDALTYLLGSSGDWVSGTILNVSGGWVRGR